MKPKTSMQQTEDIAASIFPETSLTFVEAMGAAHVFYRFGIGRSLATELSALLFPKNKLPNAMQAQHLLTNRKFDLEDIQTLFNILPIKGRQS